MEEETVSSPAESNRKRKFQNEHVELPLPKHVCWGERHEYNPPSTRNCESNHESGNGSNSFHADADSYMSAYDEAKTDHEYSQTCTSDEPCTTSSSWGASSAEFDLYSLESRSLTTPSLSKSESVSISKERDCPHHGCGLPPSLSYEDHLHEFGSHADCCCSEYRNYGFEYCKELENLFPTDGAASSDYILSSGRQSVHQDTQQGSPKLTIDKEFEQYFSTLML